VLVADDTSMEDTGEIVHVRPSDFRGIATNGDRSSYRKLTYYEDEDGGSDLDLGKTRVNGAGRAAKKGSPLSSGIPADDEDTESDLDQGVSRVTPGKKSGKMGIMRRKGVSKVKGSPYRSSGSSHDDDMSQLISSNPSVDGSLQMQRRNGMVVKGWGWGRESGWAGDQVEVHGIFSWFRL